MRRQRSAPRPFSMQVTGISIRQRLLPVRTV